MSFLIAITSGFAAGVFIRSLFFTSWWPVLFFVLIGALCSAFYFIKPRIAHGLCAVFCICVALGMIRAALADTPLPISFASDLHHKVTYEGVVVSDPDVRDANQRMEIEVTKEGESTTLLAVAPRTSDVSLGDRVTVTGVLLTPEPFADDGGRTFRYDKYLERDGVRFIMNFAFVHTLEPAPWYSLSAALAHVKHAFLNGINATLPEPHSSLAGGIVIGGKSGLGNDLKNDFVKSGLVQIIVLSGYNVMIVAEWVMAALALTALPRRWSAFAGAVALLLFVGIAGATATSIRAALMAIIALYARATGRTYAAGRALLFVILLMLVWNPLYLVFDPGFGLSVVATAGLIWLAPLIEVILSKWKSEFWKGAVATTLAAQVAVLPLLLYDTGNLSLVSVPANLLIMPLVPLAMLFSAVAGFAGMLFGTIAPMVGIAIAFPAYLANAFLLFVAHESTALPYASVTLPPFPFWLVLVAYALLVYLASSKRFSTTLQLRFAKKASM